MHLARLSKILSGLISNSLRGALISRGLFIAGFLLLFVPYVTAQEEPCSSYEQNRDCLTQEIAEAIGIDVNLSFFNVFGGNSQKPEVENLYFTIYSSLQQTPSDQALKTVAENNQYTQEEMQQILSGSLGTLFQTQSQMVSNEDAFQLLQKLREDYDDEYADALHAQELFLDSYPKEIFANGDTADSGFDVLYDLEIIELLLFEDTSSTANSGGNVEFSFGEDEETDDSMNTSESESSSNESSTEATNSQEENETAEDSQANEDETTDSDPSGSDTDSSSSEPINSAFCLADESLQAAFESTEEEEDHDQETDSSSSDSDSDSATSPETSNESSSESSVDSDETIDPGESAAIPSTVTPAEPADWTSPLPCNSVFCLVIRFLNTEEPAHVETSNCIQCHVERIVEALQKTTSVSLVPGKVPGNLLEPAICKRALLDSSVNLNFIPVAMPIQTPPGDDLITGMSLCESLSDFIEDTQGDSSASNFESLCSSSSNEDLDSEAIEKLADSYQESINDQIKKQQSISSSSTSALETYEQATVAYESELKTIQQAVRNSTTRARMASSNTNFYQSVGHEMDQMNAYFTSFKQLIGLTQKLATEMEKNLKRVE